MDRGALAARAGVEPAFVDDLVRLGALDPAAPARAGDGDVRRTLVIHDLERGGIPRTILAEAIAMGALSLDFVDQPSYPRSPAWEGETFAEVATRTGTTFGLLAPLGRRPVRPHPP